jgi:hypothetical protein
MHEHGREERIQRIAGNPSIETIRDPKPEGRQTVLEDKPLHIPPE